MTAGSKVITRALRDAGMEVIYTGLRYTPEMIVEAAAQEDVDVIGLSILSGAHMSLVPRVMDLLKTGRDGQGQSVCRRHHPRGGYPSPLKTGVTAVYGPGTSTQAVVKDVEAGGLDLLSCKFELLIFME